MRSLEARGSDVRGGGARWFRLTDDTRLDTMGFAPVGRVVQGLDVVDALYAGYGEEPSQARLTREGEAYLSQEFPRLDVIRRARLLNGRAPSGSS